MKWIKAAVIFFLPIMAAAQVKTSLISGINISTIRFEEKFKNHKPLVRYKGGLLVEFPFEKKWSMLSGLYYSGKGMVYGRSPSTGKIDSFIIKLNYVELPVNILYSFESGDENKISLSAGPFVGYGFNGIKRIRRSINPPIKHLHKKETDRYKRLELGLNISVTYEFKSRYGIFTGYSRSIPTIHRYNKERNNVFSLSIIYFLNKKQEE